MPPKPRFTREEIATAALALIKEKGVAALTARELGSRLGTSARPIFTTFRNMDEVKWAARALALREFEAYASDFTDYTPAFKRIGMLMVSYAIHEPELFKLLFMQEHTEGQSFENTIRDLGSIADVCMELIQRDYDMTPTESRILFEQMWVHAFGMGALCAMKVCDFSEEEISKKLGQVFAGMVLVIKGGKLDQILDQPVRDPTGNSRGQLLGRLPFLEK